MVHPVLTLYIFILFMNIIQMCLYRASFCEQNLIFIFHLPNYQIDSQLNQTNTTRGKSHETASISRDCL